MNENLLTAAYAIWALFTLGAYLAYRLDGQARSQAWRHIAEERRKLWMARRMLEDEHLRKQFPGARDELDHYLGDKPPLHRSDR